MGSVALQLKSEDAGGASLMLGVVSYAQLFVVVGLLVTLSVVFWNRRKRGAALRRQQRLRSVELRERLLDDPSPSP